MKNLVFLIVFIGALIWFFLPERANFNTGQVDFDIAPIQTAASAGTFSFKGYTLTPLADFTVSARVLSKSIYRIDREAKLAPVDLVLGWQSMANLAVIDRIRISQSNRFYHWYTDNFPIPRNDIETQSANMHMIPSSDEIENQLKALPNNVSVRLTGFLVSITAADGWNWRSSMTRSDTGHGACEVFYVTGIVVGK